METPVTKRSVRIMNKSYLVTAFAVLAILALTLFAMRWVSDSAIPEVPGVTLTDIHSIEELRERFN